MHFDWQSSLECCHFGAILEKNPFNLTQHAKAPYFNAVKRGLLFDFTVSEYHFTVKKSLFLTCDFSKLTLGSN